MTTSAFAGKIIWIVGPIANGFDIVILQPRLVSHQVVRINLFRFCQCNVFALRARPVLLPLKMSESLRTQFDDTENTSASGTTNQLEDNDGRLTSRSWSRRCESQGASLQCQE